MHSHVWGFLPQLAAAEYTGYLPQPPDLCVGAVSAKAGVVYVCMYVCMYVCIYIECVFLRSLGFVATCGPNHCMAAPFYWP